VSHHVVMPNSQVMQAITQRAFGGPEVLELVELPRPDPGPDEVRIRTAAIGVNPADWKRRAGLLRHLPEPPFTLGMDFAGVVEALGGPSDRLQVGDAVYGCVRPPAGAYATHVVVPIDAVAPAPATLGPVSAAALPVAALTAWQPLVHVADVQAGQRVLVHAAAGGIGHLAVQIAKARGAYVIGTARAVNHDFLRALGADELIDHTTTDFATQVQDVDVVIDPISEDYGPRSLEVLAPDGVLIDVRGTGPDRTAIQALAAARGQRYVRFGFQQSGADLDAIAALVDRGALRVHVERVLPLHEAARAHALSETGHVRGKLVLLPVTA
jgi:NADPH:quinone reductase-like Zn-dependent oxidoreductase